MIIKQKLISKIATYLLCIFTVFSSIAGNANTIANTINNTYYRKINIQNGIGKDFVNKLVLIRIDTKQLILTNKLDINCKSLHALDLDSNSMDIWLESGCNTIDTLLWVNIPVPDVGTNLKLEYSFNNPNPKLLTNPSVVAPILAQAKIWVAGNRMNLSDGSSISSFANLGTDSSLNFTPEIQTQAPKFKLNAKNGLPGIQFRGNDNANKTILQSNYAVNMPNMTVVAANLTEQPAFCVHGNNKHYCQKAVAVGFNDGIGMYKNYYQHPNQGNSDSATSLWGVYSENNSTPIIGNLTYTGKLNDYTVNIATKTSSKLGLKVNQESMVYANNTVTNSFDKITLGGFSGNQSYHFPSALTGNIPEVLIYDKVLNEVEIDINDDYINTKYEIYKTPISNYIDSEYLYDFPFTDYPGFKTKAPWRSYQETVPVSKYINGVGIVGGCESDIVTKNLANNGIKTMRIEIAWSQIGYDDIMEQSSYGKWFNCITNLKNNGIRPMILTNAHHGASGAVKYRWYCPNLQATAQGATTIQVPADLATNPNFVLGYTGIDDLTDYLNNEVIITEINGTTATLSKPLTRNINLNEKICFSTLKHLPFTPIGSPTYQDTVNGWMKYMDEVARVATNALGTNLNFDDKGFDIEIWNEMTFGSNFLNYNNYFSNTVDWSNKETADIYLPKLVSNYVSGKANYKGVRFTNGFESQRPWASGTSQPTNVTAISKHYYSDVFDSPTSNNTPSNKKIAYIESPFDSWRIETEARDTTPLPNNIYGGLLGRYARGDEVGIWETESGLDTTGYFTPTTQSEEMALKAKIVARNYLFRLGKGVERVYQYAIGNPNINEANNTPTGDVLGIGGREIRQLANTPGAIYPANDTLITSAPIKSLGNISKFMKGVGYDAFNVKDTRPIYIRQYNASGHNNLQWPAEPANNVSEQTNQDRLLIQPFQRKANQFVIAYYVMTFDQTKALPSERYNIDLANIAGNGANIKIYNPINNTYITDFTIINQDSNSLKLNVPAIDTPYLIEINENNNLTPIIQNGKITTSITNEGLNEINISIKANLSGVYNTNTNKLNSILKSRNLIPLSSPNNTNSKTQIPVSSVDWITIELRQSNSIKATKEEIIDENGNINISFDTVTAGNYDIILRHRNHLAISTSNPINLSTGVNSNQIDFTNNQNVKGLNQTQIRPGIYGLRAGNPNSDNSIDAADRNTIKNTIENSNTYSNSDLNLDGVIDAVDRNILKLQVEGVDGI